VKAVHTRAVAERYLKHFQDVAIFNMHESKRMDIWFFCGSLPEANATCEAMKSRKVNNQRGASVDLDYRRLVFAAQERGMLGGKDISFAANAAQHRQENILNQTAFDFPKECLSNADLQTLLQVSLDEEEHNVPSFFQTPDGEEKLRLDFDIASNTTLCSINVDKILMSPSWVDFFQTL